METADYPSIETKTLKITENLYIFKNDLAFLQINDFTD
jgi:hypothetical protein